MSDLQEQRSSLFSSWLLWSGRAFCWWSTLCDRLALVIGTPADQLHLAGNHTLDLHASTSDLKTFTGTAVSCPDHANTISVSFSEDLLGSAGHQINTYFYQRNVFL